MFYTKLRIYTLKISGGVCVFHLHIHLHLHNYTYPQRNPHVKKIDTFPIIHKLNLGMNKRINLLCHGHNFDTDIISPFYVHTHNQIWPFPHLINLHNIPTVVYKFKMGFEFTCQLLTIFEYIHQLYQPLIPPKVLFRASYFYETQCWLK